MLDSHPMPLPLGARWRRQGQCFVLVTKSWTSCLSNPAQLNDLSSHLVSSCVGVPGCWHLASQEVRDLTEGNTVEVDEDSSKLSGQVQSASLTWSFEHDKKLNGVIRIWRNCSGTGMCHLTVKGVMTTQALIIINHVCPSSDFELGACNLLQQYMHCWP